MHVQEYIYIYKDFTTHSTLPALSTCVLVYLYHPTYYTDRYFCSYIQSHVLIQNNRRKSVKILIHCYFRDSPTTACWAAYVAEDPTYYITSWYLLRTFLSLKTLHKHADNSGLYSLYLSLSINTIISSCCWCLLFLLHSSRPRNLRFFSLFLSRVLTNRYGSQNGIFRAYGGIIFR